MSLGFPRGCVCFFFWGSFLSFSLRFCKEIAKRTAVAAVWRIGALRSTVFVERNEPRNFDPQKSAGL